MLKPLQGAYGLFCDTNTGQVINLRGYRPHVRLMELERSGRQMHASQVWQRYFVLRRWSVLLDLWPKLIAPSLLVSLTMCDQYIAERMPLHVVAEPLKVSRDPELERRIKRIEQHMGLEHDLPNPLGSPISTTLCLSNAQFIATVEGPADDMTPQFEMLRYCAVQLVGFEGGSYV
jgi:hypothetical protein